MKLFLARARDERGFTIVESMVALMLIMGALVGSLTVMSSSVRGIVTSRERSVATSLAREVVERARGAEYSTVGHDLDDDTGLASDPETSGSPLSYGSETLTGSSVDKDTTSPFYPHLRTKVVGGVTYTTRAYVTQVVPATGDHYKRVTVVAQWGNDQYNGAVADTVRLESLIYDALEPPDPLLIGVAEVDAGSVRMLDDYPPVLLDSRLAVAGLYLPFSRAEIESRFVRTARSFNRSARTELAVTDHAGVNATSPCTKTTDGGNARVECPGAQAEVVADNDAGTTPLVAPAPTSTTDAGGSLTRGDGSIGLLLGGTNAASAEATTSSTAAGNDDELPYAKGSSSGPASFSMPFDVGLVGGAIAAFSGVVQADSDVDRQGTGATSTISTSVSVSHPAVDLLTFDTDPVNEIDATDVFSSYAGMVKVGTTSVSMTTAAGPGAASPTFNGSNVSVEMFATGDDGTGAYQNVVVTPGLASTNTTTSRFLVEGELVTVVASLTSTPTVSESDVTGSTTSRAATRLTSWLSVRLDVTVGSGASFGYELSYGRLVADATYEEPT